MRIKALLKSKISFYAFILIGIVSLIFGNFDSSTSVNAPTFIENFFNFALIASVVALGINANDKLISDRTLFRKIISWPKLARFSVSIFLVLVVFGVASIPAIALRGAIDPGFKERHLAAQQAIADQAAADQAAAEKKAADQAAAEKKAADQAAADKKASGKPTSTPTQKTASQSSNNEKLGGFTAQDIKNFKVIISNIRSYASALDSGNTLRATQACNVLDDNYNQAMRGVHSTSSLASIEDLLDKAKDAMYGGVTDCTRGFRKNRLDLVSDSISQFVEASKYLDGIVMVSAIK